MISLISEETYGYDSEGVRILKKSAGTKTVYAVDKMLSYSQVLVEIKSVDDESEVSTNQGTETSNAETQNQTQNQDNNSEEQKENDVRYYYTRGNRLVCRNESGSKESAEAENHNDENNTGENNTNAENETAINSAGKVFYLHDGHGNVKTLADDDGKVTDTYSYNSYGILLTKTGTTENEYLYCEEERDNAAGLYYLRARYMNPLTGTFTQKDTYEGHIYSPVTQNGYMYTGGNPVMYADPSGNDSIPEFATAGAMETTLEAVYVPYAYYMKIITEITAAAMLITVAYYTGIAEE